MQPHPLKIHYEKRKNSELFKSMKNEDGLNLSNTQNYMPIYEKFFLLNESNYNSINLNHEYYISSLLEKDKERKNVYKCQLQNISNDKKTQKSVFFKMAPLLDPFKYLIGKYNPDDVNLFSLPKFNSVQGDVHPKLLDVNNSSYIDGYFVFLSSLLLHKYNFIHGIDFYGSFLSIKNNFTMDVIDDIEYLDKSDFFNKHKNSLFTIEDYSFLLETSPDEEKKKPLIIEKNVSISNQSVLSIESIQDDLWPEWFHTLKMICCRKLLLCKT